MDFTQEFIQNCLKTESKDFPKICSRLTEEKTLNALKYYMEIFEYYGEQLDILKKYIFYGRLPKDKDFFDSAPDNYSPTPTIEGNNDIRILHAMLGIATESVEGVQAVREHMFEGKALDKINIREELGDGLYYAGIGFDAVGETSFEPTMKRITKKLDEVRYKNGFTEEAANNRDLEKEREVLEND